MGFYIKRWDLKFTSLCGSVSVQVIVQMPHTKILQIFEEHLLCVCLGIGGAGKGRNKDEKGRVPVLYDTAKTLSAFPFQPGTNVLRFLCFCCILFFTCSIHSLVLYPSWQVVSTPSSCHSLLPQTPASVSFFPALILILLGFSCEKTVSFFSSLPSSLIPSFFPFF